MTLRLRYGCFDAISVPLHTLGFDVWVGGVRLCRTFLGYLVLFFGVKKVTGGDLRLSAFLLRLRGDLIPPNCKIGRTHSFCNSQLGAGS